MVKTKIFETDYCDIYYDDAEGVLIAKWSGFLKPDEVRAGCKAMTKYIEENKVKLHLSDHTDLKVLSKEVQDYLTQEWFQEVENLGLEKIAVQVSENAFAKATVDKVNEEAQVGSLKIFTLGSKKDCIKWLKAS